ncbi:hypothetical protein MRX96_008288 [Rhipicephalus microplus]
MHSLSGTCFVEWRGSAIVSEKSCPTVSQSGRQKRPALREKRRLQRSTPATAAIAGYAGRRLTHDASVASAEATTAESQASRRRARRRLLTLRGRPRCDR